MKSFAGSTSGMRSDSACVNADSTRIYIVYLCLRERETERVNERERESKIRRKREKVTEIGQRSSLSQPVHTHSFISCREKVNRSIIHHR